jgi:hypothetical protein
MQPAKRPFFKPSNKLNIASLIVLLGLLLITFRNFNGEINNKAIEQDRLLYLKNEAYTKYKCEDYKNAARIISAYLNQNTGDSSARNMLVTCYIKLGRLDLANREATIELKKSPDDPNVLLRSAYLAFLLEKYPEAVRYLKLGLKTDRSDLQFNIQLAEAYYQAKDIKSAISEWKSVLRQLKKSDPRAKVIRKRIASAKGEDAGSGVGLQDTMPVQMFTAGDGEDNQTTIMWSLRDSANVSGVRILKRADGNFPTGPFDRNASLVYSNPSALQTDIFTDISNVKSASRIHYTMFTKNSAGAWSRGSNEYLNADVATTGPIVSITKSDLEPGWVFQGRHSVPLVLLSLKTGFSAAKLSGLPVKIFGSANINRICAYLDGNQNGRLDDSDYRIGSLDVQGSHANSPYGDSAVIEISPVPLKISEKNAKIILAADIQDDADASKLSGITVEGALTSDSSGKQPILNPILEAANINTKLFSIRGNIVNVSSSSDIKSLQRGHEAIVMQKIKLSTDFATAKLTALNVGKLGTVGDNKISSVAIYDDKNMNGVINAGERRLSVSSFRKGAAHLVMDTPQIISTVPRFFLVTYDVMRNTKIGSTAGSKIIGKNGVEIKAPDYVAGHNSTADRHSGILGSNNLTSNSVRVVASQDNLSLSHNPTKPTSKEQGSANIVLDSISLSAPRSGDGAVIKGLKVNENESLTGDAISKVKLIEDSKRTGVYDPEHDRILATATLKKGSAKFIIPGGLTIDPDSSCDLLLLADLSETASIGTQVQTVIPDQLSIYTVKPDRISPFIDAKSRAINIIDKPDNLFVEQKPLINATIKVGSKDRLAQRITMRVDNDKVALKKLTVRIAGNLDPKYIDDIKLWLDSNGNGSVDKNDKPVSTVSSPSGRVIVFRNSQLEEMSKNKGATLLITHSISADAPAGKTLAYTITKNSDVSVSYPDRAKVIENEKATKTALITTVPQAPTTPEHLVATAGENRKIALRWKPNSKKQNVTDYKIFRSAAKSGPYSQVGSTIADKSEFMDTVPKPGTYWYRVTASNVSGDSTASAANTVRRIKMACNVSAENETTTVKSADNSVTLYIPNNGAYEGKSFTAQSTSVPSGVEGSFVSEHFYEFDTNAREPFNPPLTIMLKCNMPVDDSVKIYHYKDGEWKPVTGGRYIYEGNYIGYTNITEFSGYGAVQANSNSGYNNPLQYTSGPKGPHGGYVNSTNKCKECHSIHLASGLYRLTRANERDETCDYCHGIGGLAATAVVLDENGHGVATETVGNVIAPDDTNPPYSIPATKWGCLECHSAHGNQTVKLAGFVTDKLLKSNPNRDKSFLYYAPAVGETTQTISQWCTTCHNTTFGSSSNPITVDESTTVFGHSSSGTGMTTDTGGYAEVDTDDGVNKGPTCRQCHLSTARTDITTGFPHASGAATSLLDTDTASTKIDNGCIRCHQVSSLP